MAIDVWDGGTSQVNIFASNTQISYPILMFGGQAGFLSDYNCGYDYFFVVGGDGIIKWRGDWDQTTVAGALDAAVAELATSDVADLPQPGLRLHANYPNPFNPVTRIPYEVGATADAATVRLDVLDLRGRLVRNLVAGVQSGGQTREAVWNGTDERGRGVPSGTYLARLTVDGVVQSRIMTLVK